VGRPSLRVLLFALFTCAATLPALLLGAFQVQAWLESESARADRETLLASTSLAREVTRFLDARAEAVRALALELGADEDVSHTAVERATARFMRVFSGFYGIRVTDLEGTSLGASPVEQSAPRSVYLERDYFRRIVAGADFAVSDMLRSKAYGRPAIILAAAVRDHQGRRIGVVVAGVDLTMVEHAIQRVVGAAPGLAGAVLDESGQLIASAGAAHWQPLDKLGELPLFRAPTAELPERRLGLDRDGQQYRGTSVRIASSLVNWSAFTRWPEALVKERGERALRQMGAFAMGGLGLSVLMALVLARAVAAPLGRLSALVEGIGRGELHRRPDPPRRWYPREFTRFAISISETLAWLDALLQEIGRTASAVSHATQRLRGDSTNLVRESQGQAHAVSHGSGAIVKLTDSIAHVSQSTRDLSRAAGETSASLTNLDGQILQIADHLQTLTHTIEHASSEVEQMGRQVSSTSESTSELAENVQRTATSVETLGTSIEHVATSAAESERLAKEAIVAAEAGRLAVEETIGATREIQESFSAVDAAVQGLAGRSEAIGQVVRVIDEVTRATELLSINASIIASQAGEHGRSFGIVAGRVKELALETGSSTRAITSLVESVQADIEQAVRAVQQGQQTVQKGEQRSSEAGRRLRLIIESSGEAEGQVRQIAQATRQQSSGLRNVRQALSEVNRATAQIESNTLGQRHAQQQMATAVEQVRRVGQEVRRSTELQTTESHAIADAVRSMTARLAAIANASATQSDDRARIQQSLGTFEGALRTGVARARQIDEVVSTLSARLEELERQLRLFRLE